MLGEKSEWFFNIRNINFSRKQLKKILHSDLGILAVTRKKFRNEFENRWNWSAWISKQFMKNRRWIYLEDSVDELQLQESSH